MAFFVRPSKYRHVYGTCAKREASYDNLRVSANAWDTNMVKANPVSVLVIIEQEQFIDLKVLALFGRKLAVFRWWSFCCSSSLSSW